jgi:PAS domain S-box-containing protein
MVDVPGGSPRTFGQLAQRLGMAQRARDAGITRPGAPADVLLAAALEAAPSAIVLCDRDLRIVGVNKAAERLLGTHTGQVGSTLADALPDVASGVANAIEHAFQDGETSGELEIGHGNGRPRLTVRVFPVRPSGERVEIVGCMLADASDDRGGGADAAELSAIVTSSEDAILSKALDGTIRSWNAAAERLYGYTAAEAVGRSIAIIVPDELASEIGEILGEITANRRVEHFETVRRRKDGSLVEVSLSVSPVHDRSGKVVAASVIARDVSGRRALEAALQESERRRLEILASMLRAEEAERSRIATELHDDTVQVMTASLFALDRVALIARRSENEQIESAVTVTRATLEEATARARRLMFELRPAILHEQGLVAAVNVIADQTRRETGARTAVRGSAGRYGHAVEEIAYRSIQEALSNVRRHAAATEVEIRLADDGEALVCEVADDGRGFDAEAVRGRPGAALHAGLDTMIERIRAAGGTSTLRTAPGRGTRVRMRIPIQPTEPAR